jgi:hypothetical protein
MSKDIVSIVAQCTSVVVIFCLIEMHVQGKAKVMSLHSDLFVATMA